MTRKERFDNFKKAFNKFLFDASTTQLTTKDNKKLIVMGDDLAEGVEIYELADDNTQKPLNDGDYELQDGRKFTVANNMVKSITAPEPAKEGDETPVENAKVKLADGMPDGQENGATPAAGDIEARLSALEQEVAELMNAMSGSMEAQKKTMSKLNETFAKVKQIANEPGGEPVKIGKKLKTGEVTSDENIASIDGILNRLKDMQSFSAVNAKNKKVPVNTIGREYVEPSKVDGKAGDLLSKLTNRK